MCFKWVKHIWMPFSLINVTFYGISNLNYVMLDVLLLCIFYTIFPIWAHLRAHTHTRTRTHSFKHMNLLISQRSSFLFVCSTLTLFSPFLSLSLSFWKTYFIFPRVQYLTTMSICCRPLSQYLVWTFRFWLTHSFWDWHTRDRRLEEQQYCNHESGQTV